MRKCILIIGFAAFLAFTAVEGHSDEHKYRLGITYGLGNLKASEEPNFGFSHALGFMVGIQGSRLGLTFSLLSQNNYSNAYTSGHFSFFPDKDVAKSVFKSLRAGFDFDYKLKRHGHFRPAIGVGIGYLIWRYEDPAGDTVIQTTGNLGNTVDFSAAEMYLSTSLGIDSKISERISPCLKISFDYLTGLGTDFSESVRGNRDRILMRAVVTVSYLFNPGQKQRPAFDQWPSSDVWTDEVRHRHPTSYQLDEDGDGIADKDDDCPNTPAGAMVDNDGCTSDSDGDGVPDGLDDCPRSPPSALGYVDIFGCPVDSDYDGIPDYRDSCRFEPVGAVVDESGCAVDSDGDGVYDGLDDCPDTDGGIDVDHRGCIDVSFLRDVMRVYVDYQSGSFEIDQRTRKRLQPLIKKLSILSDVKITVIGYTDNVGPAKANQELSQKRANRMRDWMVEQGIARERLEAIGKGKTNFIASNETAEGRAKNRRIEFVFSR